MSYDSTDVKCPEPANPQRQRADGWLLGMGKGKWGVTADGGGVSFRGDGNVLKLDRGDGCPILQLNQNPLNSTRQTGEFYGM